MQSKNSSCLRHKCHKTSPVFVSNDTAVASDLSQKVTVLFSQRTSSMVRSLPHSHLSFFSVIPQQCVRDGCAALSPKCWRHSVHRAHRQHHHRVGIYANEGEFNNFFVSHLASFDQLGTDLSQLFSTMVMLMQSFQGNPVPSLRQSILSCQPKGC